CVLKTVIAHHLDIRGAWLAGNCWLGGVPIASPASGCEPIIVDSNNQVYFCAQQGKRSNEESAKREGDRLRVSRCCSAGLSLSLRITHSLRVRKGGTSMDRRSFIKTAGLVGIGAAGSTGLAMPAIAQGKITWRMPTTWPKNFPGIGVGAQRLADKITAA